MISLIAKSNKDVIAKIMPCLTTEDRKLVEDEINRKREYNRNYMRNKRKNNPQYREKENEYSRSQRANNPEKFEKYKEQNKQKYHTDPEYRKGVLDKVKERQRVKREQSLA